MHRLTCIVLCLLAGCSSAVADPEAKSELITHYSSDPGHLWNRLHAALLTRPDREGKMVGRDSLDPLVFPTTKRLLEGPSHIEALKLLDQFLADGHKLVRDPVQRAIFQRDLWAVFDWAAYPFGNFYTAGDPIEVREGPLQSRLAKAIRKLALSRDEVAALPDTFALAVRSKAFPVEFDPAKPNDPFLPPDLFDPSGPWVCVTAPDDLASPIASEHARVFAGRSVFLVFISLPEGRKATLEYLDRLNTFRNPWKVPPREPSENGQRPPLPELNPEVPQFPAGTQVALVRQLVVLNDAGQPVPTSLTESIQIRTYCEILPPEKDTAIYAEMVQRFVELEFTRADLFAGKNGGLRALKGDDHVRPSLTFFRGWIDDFESQEEVGHSHNRLEPAFRRCSECHSRGGIRGVNSYSQTGAVRPTSTLGLFPTRVAGLRARSAEWKTGLKDFATLKKLAEW